MRTPVTFARQAHRFAAVMILILPAVSVRADPISLPEKPITPEISFAIGFAILLEVICIWWMLRRSRHPRFLVFWLLGMHLVTYPPFLGLLWVLQDVRPAYAVACGEGLVVIVEGILIYLICRFVSSPKNEVATSVPALHPAKPNLC
jgi:hypothetical protein